MQIQLGAFDRHWGWTGGCWRAQLISWSFLLQLNRKSPFLLNLTPSLINQFWNVLKIPDQKDKWWHHQKRTHFFLCPFLCPSVPWVTLANSAGRHVCPHPFLWQQSPSGSFRPPARPPPHRQGHFLRTDLSASRSDFQSPRLQILLYQWGWGEESGQEEGGRETDGRVSLWKLE